jgi:predicted DNA-binding transcriptional regulator YafY
VVLKTGKWYLVARSEGQFRTYRVNQILGLTTRSGHFERTAAFDLPAYWASSVSDFRAGLHRGEATIRLSPAGRQRMRETMSSAVIAAAEQTAAAADAEGWVTAVVPIESVDHAHGEFLRLGADVEILLPGALRDRMRQTARSLGLLYPATGTE